MPMNNQMLRWLLVWALVTGFCLPPVMAWMEPDNSLPPTPQTSASEAQKTALQTGTDNSNAAQNAPQAPPVPSVDTASRPLEEFKPTEEIGADSAVSFPVDI